MLNYTGPAYQSHEQDRSGDYLLKGYEGLNKGITAGFEAVASKLEDTRKKRDERDFIGAQWATMEPVIMGLPDGHDLMNKFAAGGLNQQRGLLTGVAARLHQQEQAAMQGTKDQQWEKDYGLRAANASNAGAATQANINNQNADNTRQDARLEMEQAAGAQKGWYADPTAPGYLLHPSGAKLELNKARTSAGLRIAPIEGMPGFGMLLNGDKVADKERIYREEEVPGTARAGENVAVREMPGIPSWLKAGLPPELRIGTPATPNQKTWKPTQLEFGGDKNLVKRRTKDADGIESEEFFTFDPKTGKLLKAEPALFPPADSKMLTDPEDPGRGTTDSLIGPKPPALKPARKIW